MTPFVTLVRGPLIASARALNTEATPALRRWPVRRLKQAGAWGLVVVVYWYSYITLLTALAGVTR